MANPYRTLEQHLGYRFRRRRRLDLALTHPSFRHETPEMDTDNQRLEFLGDAVLNLVTAEWLYEHRPDEEEGRLTQFRSSVTSTAALGEIASDIGLGGYLRLGRGELKAGGARRIGTLADALEAVVGAAYLDGGLKAARRIFIKLIVPRIEALRLSYASDNAKGILQELCQRRWGRRPEYSLVSERGRPHARVYVCEVTLGGRPLGAGEGPNRKTAELRAAAEAIRQLEQENDK
jgi:ribonuclease-3